jgi:sec-independent protein translocase protein TatA
MIGTIGLPQLLVILAIVILIFGVGRISGLGRELGSSIKEFRRAVKDPDQEAKEAQDEQAAQIAAPQQQPAPPSPPPSAPLNEKPKEPVESGRSKGPNVF